MLSNSSVERGRGVLSNSYKVIKARCTKPPLPLHRSEAPLSTGELRKETLNIQRKYKK
jgi:hypothetical protein